MSVTRKGFINSHRKFVTGLEFMTNLEFTTNLETETVPEKLYVFSSTLSQFCTNLSDMLRE